MSGCVLFYQGREFCHHVCIFRVVDEISVFGGVFVRFKEHRPCTAPVVFYIFPALGADHHSGEVATVLAPHGVSRVVPGSRGIVKQRDKAAPIESGGLFQSAQLDQRRI